MLTYNLKTKILFFAIVMMVTLGLSAPNTALAQEFPLPEGTTAFKGKDYEVSIHIFDADADGPITVDTTRIRVKYKVENKATEYNELDTTLYIGEVSPTWAQIYNGDGLRADALSENTCSLHSNWVKPELSHTRPNNFVDANGSLILDFEDVDNQEVFELGTEPECQLEPGTYVFRHTFQFVADGSTDTLIQDVFGEDFYEQVSFGRDVFFTVEAPSVLEEQLTRIERRISSFQRWLYMIWRSIRR